MKMVHGGSPDRKKDRPWARGASRRPRRDALPRPVLLLSCFLALATGLALLGAAAAFTDHPAPPQSAVESPTAAAIDLVHRFYATVNDVLRTGDAAPLAAVVAPGLVQHPGRSGDPGAAGLARTILAERTTWPGIRLVVDDIRATGPDAVTAWVHPEASNPPDVPGFAMAATPAGWGPIEVLRIEGELIAERWASDTDALRFEPLGQLPLFDTEARSVVKVEWHTIQPGATDDLFGGAGAGPRLLYAESGSVNVALAQPQDSPPTPMVPGAVLTLAAHAAGTMTNTGPQPARVLVAMAMHHPPEWGSMASGPSATQSNAGVAVATLTHLPVPKTEQPTIDRVTLEPGVSLTGGADVGNTLILVERGTIWMTPADDRDVQVRTTDGGLEMRPPEEPLMPGDLVHLGVTGLTGAWQAGANEPVALLVMSTGPANAGPA